KVTVTWIDLLSILLTAVMGMSLWHLVSDVLRGDQPDEGAIQDRFQIPQLQRELAMAEEAWKATSKKLAEQRLEQIDQAAKLGIFAKTTAEYRAVLLQSTMTSRGVERLLRYLQAQETDVGRREAALSRARRAAARAWEEINNLHEQRRKLTTLGWAMVLATALLVVLWLLLSWQAARAPSGSVHPQRVVFTAGTLLTVLFSYQTFDASGFALVSAALLLFLLTALLRKSF